MPRPPIAPDKLPLMEHNGHAVEVVVHHGYSIPDMGPLPRDRVLYGARDQNGERHWRSSLEEIGQLIDRNFGAAPLASGVS